MKHIFYMAGLLCSAGMQGQPGANAIRINQLGYYEYASKIAVVAEMPAADTFYLLDAAAKDTVYRGKTGPILSSANSSLHTRVMDFSAFTRPGKYTIAIAGLPPSYPFVIGAHVQRPVALASLKGFYYMRASMALDKAFAGQWARAAGHADNIVFVHASAATERRPAGTVIAAPGGWYDAGDYNKYIVNSGITMGTLLAAYEDFPAYFDTLQTHIPESGKGLPDILNEALYNLRWMLTMQDPHDGGVYHKCTNAAFDSMVMPAACRLPRYVVQKGTAATLDFAAVMAQCSRIARKMERLLPGLSDSCLHAAKKAWQWAMQHPDLVYDQDTMNRQYQPRISTGAYGDRHFSDEWFWAAAELLITSNEKPYRSIVLEKIGDSMELPSWSNVRMLGFYSLLRHQASLPAMASFLPEIKQRMIRFADNYLLHIKENAFQAVMGQSRNNFNWGSNANAANQGIALVNAYLLTHNRLYLEGALSNLDYLLGRNATGYCFITGLGSRSPLHPHHRPSIADGIEAPVPGLLAGGPNPGMQDKCHYAFTEPETAYTDTDCSYASNEVAINWNAPLVYLANAIEALQYTSAFSK